MNLIGSIGIDSRYVVNIGVGNEKNNLLMSSSVTLSLHGRSRRTSNVTWHVFFWFLCFIEILNHYYNQIFQYTYTTIDLMHL